MTAPAPDRPQPEPRSAHKAFRTIGTRWADNDVYGHVNNVVYSSWFDTAVNAHLIERGALDLHHGQAMTAAKGHFIHVYVDKASRRPTALPARLREVLETLE